MRFRLSFCARAILLCILAGCQAQPRAHDDAAVSRAAIDNDDAIVIAAERYQDAFDAAVQVVRGLGYEPAFLDRRFGRIETAPRRSGSLLEPWVPSVGGSASAGWENTLHYQRRIIRFEFASLAFALPSAAGSEPDLLGLTEPPIDLTQTTDPLRLRITVVVERQQAPTESQAGWSLDSRNESWLFDPATGEQRPVFWQPVRRDPSMERELLRKVAYLL